MVDDFKESMKELHRRLRVSLASGYIGLPSFNVGMQILCAMVSARSANLAFTWQELARSPVISRGVVLADVAPAGHYEFYGALQQLENRLGLVTHVTRTGLMDHITAGREAKEYHHMTGEPGVDSLVIVEDTTVLCIYEAWVGSTLDDDVENYLSQFQERAELPSWVSMPHKKSLP